MAIRSNHGWSKNDLEKKKKKKIPPLPLSCVYSKSSNDTILLIKLTIFQ